VVLFIKLYDIGHFVNILHLFTCILFLYLVQRCVSTAARNRVKMEAITVPSELVGHGIIWDRGTAFAGVNEGSRSFCLSKENRSVVRRIQQHVYYNRGHSKRGHSASKTKLRVKNMRRDTCDLYFSFLYDTFKQKSSCILYRVTFW
jgi:hypothetical protein